MHHPATHFSCRWIRNIFNAIHLSFTAQPILCVDASEHLPIFFVGVIMMINAFLWPCLSFSHANCLRLEATAACRDRVEQRWYPRNRSNMSSFRCRMTTSWQACLVSLYYCSLWRWLFSINRRALASKRDAWRDSNQRISLGPPVRCRIYVLIQGNDGCRIERSRWYSFHRSHLVLDGRRRP